MTTKLLSLSIDSHDAGGAIYHEGKLIHISRPYMVKHMEANEITKLIEEGKDLYIDPHGNYFTWDVLDREKFRDRSTTEEYKILLAQFDKLTNGV